MKYDESKVLERRAAAKEVGALYTMFNTTNRIEDNDLIDLLHAIDKSIGFFDGLEGENSLISFAFIHMRERLIGVARLRGLTSLSQ